MCEHNAWLGDPDLGDCFDCEEAAHAVLHPEMDDPNCRTCCMRSVQLSPSCYPTSKNKVPPRTPNNSYEKGIALDHRGIPYRDSKLNPIPIKEFTANRRKYEDQIRQHVAQRDAVPA